MKRRCPGWLASHVLLDQLGLENTNAGWASYVDHLAAVSGPTIEIQRQPHDELTAGWAIGTPVWRRTLAEAHSHFASRVGLTTPALRAIKEARWRAVLEVASRVSGG